LAEGARPWGGLAGGATFITKHIGKYWASLSIARASLDPIDYVSVCKP
jgi:hypothetical protein